MAVRDVGDLLTQRPPDGADAAAAPAASGRRRLAYANLGVADYGSDPGIRRVFPAAAAFARRAKAAFAAGEVFIMLLLALPTAATLTRGSGGGGAMLLALVLGLGFLLLDGILASLGASGQMSPLYSALGAPLLFGLIGLVRLQLCERP